MSRAKSATTSDSTEDSIAVIREAKCPTSSRKSNLSYQIGVSESGEVFLKVSDNDGGGFWSPEWVAFKSIEQAISEWPVDQGITSMAFRKIFRGKSANTPGFLVAVLCAEGLLEPMGDKQRVHQACDPKSFLAEVSALQGGSSKKPKAKAKATPRAKTVPKAKAKAPAKRTASTGKTPRKARANSRKGK